jgi:hypothetical protein
MDADARGFRKESNPRKNRGWTPMHGDIEQISVAASIRINGRSKPCFPLQEEPRMDAGARRFQASFRMWTCLGKMDAENGSLISLVVSLFEGHRGNTAERAVAPRSVVERLDVVEDGKFSLGP